MDKIDCQEIAVSRISAESHDTRVRIGGKEIRGSPRIGELPDVSCWKKSLGESLGIALRFFRVHHPVKSHQNRFRQLIGILAEQVHGKRCPVDR